MHPAAALQTTDDYASNADFCAHQGILLTKLRACGKIIHRYFGIPLILRHGVYAPDPEYSYSTGIALEAMGRRNLKGLRVLDMGTGCGVIGLLAAFRGAKVLACDKDPAAVALALENLANNRRARSDLQMEVRLSHLFRGLRPEDGPLDIIVANLYFPNAGPEFAAPRAAILRDYREFLDQAKKFLAPGGVVLLTSGTTCDETATRQVFREAGIRPAMLTRDRFYGPRRLKVGWRVYGFDRNGQPAMAG